MTERRHGPRYRALLDLDRDLCIYCGEPAEHIDHVLPLAFVTRNRAPLTQEQRLQLLTVPSCGNCNMRAGSRVFKSLMQKRNWLRVNLYERERKFLEAPVWEPWEIAQLGHGLRGFVSGSHARRALIFSRLAYEGLPEDWKDYRSVDRDRVLWRPEPAPSPHWPPAGALQ